MIGTGRLQARLQLNYLIGICNVGCNVAAPARYGRPITRPAEEFPARVPV